MTTLEIARERLERVVDAMRDRTRFLLQTHNNPDPDSIASALVLRYLIRRYTGRDAVIAFGGVVGRSENRAMVRYLDIPLVPGSLVDYTSYDFSAVLDTQPGTNFTSFPDGFVPTVVIDHHPCREESKAAEVVIVEPDYGATSTLVGEMLLAADIPIPADVATALYYGIKSETQDLCRETTEADVKVYRELEQHIDRKIISQIESEQVPREYFLELAYTIKSARIHGTAVVADLGSVRVPEMVAEMADFMLRLEAMEWAWMMGKHEGTLYLSLRTTSEEIDGGAVMVDVVKGIGYGGGHLTMAGGQVPLSEFEPDAQTERRAEVIRRFLERVGMGDAPGENLAPADDPHP